MFMFFEKWVFCGYNNLKSFNMCVYPNYTTSVSAVTAILTTVLDKVDYKY